MLLVFAGPHDQTAQALVRRWRNHDARLLTCRDLSSAGWRYYPHDVEASRASVGGQVVRFSELEGVLTRLPCVTPRELPHIVNVERSYVAAEMNAFLIAWWSSALFPVVNRPTPLCLMGPNWRPEQWLHAAARAGLRMSPSASFIKLQPSTRQATNATASGVAVTVVGARCFGAIDEDLAARACRVAELAGVELLTVQFSGSRLDADFLGAYLGADVSQNDVADALLDYFQSSTTLR